jgi:hypothetical protein
MIIHKKQIEKKIQSLILNQPNIEYEIFKKINYKRTIKKHKSTWLDCWFHQFFNIKNIKVLLMNFLVD